jgi:hypothetical protein
VFLEVWIVKGLRMDFLDVRILKDLAHGAQIQRHPHRVAAGASRREEKREVSWSEDETGKRSKELMM